MKTTRKHFNFTDIMLERIDDIRLKYGFPNLSVTINYIIAENYKREFKDYVMVKKIDDEEKNTVKKQDTHDKQSAVCLSLEGEIIDKAGTAYCVYHTYNRKNRYKQEIPLADITEDLLNMQYFPSKEKVEELEKEGNVNY